MTMDPTLSMSVSVPGRETPRSCRVWRSVAVAKHQGDAGIGPPHLGDGMLPRALTGPAHHHEVTVAEGQRVALPAGLRSDEESPRLAEGDGGDDRLGQITGNPITVECHRVVPVAIPAGADPI